MCVAAALALLIGISSVRGDDPSPSDRLAKAIKLSDDGKYTESDAILKTLKEDDFEQESQQIQLQRYVSLTSKALAAIAAARNDFSEGEKALKGDRLEAATKQFQQVKDNKYAPADLKEQSDKHLQEIQKALDSREREKEAKETTKKEAEKETKEEAKPAPKPPAPKAAPTSVQPDSAKPSAPVAQTQSGRPSIVEELALEHELLWQQAEKAYRDAESKLRKAVLAEDFPEARRLLALAKQTIELNRRYAAPSSKYEDYRNQSSQLEKFVDDEERSYEERVIREK